MKLEKGSTVLLRIAVIAIGVIALALCIFGFPEIMREGIPQLTYIVIGLYAAAVPFFLGLSEAWKLLGYIDNNKAFSDLSVKALSRIKVAAFIISGVIIICLPFFYAFAQMDDAPGLVVIGMLLAAAPFIVAVFAALLEMLFQEALRMKSENELTV